MAGIILEADDYKPVMPPSLAKILGCGDCFPLLSYLCPQVRACLKAPHTPGEMAALVHLQDGARNHLWEPESFTDTAAARRFYLNRSFSKEEFLRFTSENLS